MALLLAACAFGVAAVAPRAHAQTPPAVDGDLSDLIAYAADLRATVAGVGLDLGDPTGDVQLVDPIVVPCAPVVDGYYANGFDIERLVVAQAAGGGALYLGLRTAGKIGDTDGDGDPDASGDGPCAVGDRVPDQRGVAADEQYDFLFDTHCGPVFMPSSHLRLKGDRLVGSGIFARVDAVEGDGTFVYRGPTGRDLEIRVPAVALPPGFRVCAIVGAHTDGLSEDRSPLGLWQPLSGARLLPSAGTVALCPGAATRLSLTVRNTGAIDLTAALVNRLPAGFAYAGNASATCGVGPPREGGAGLAWPPFRLAAGAECTLGFDVRSPAGCAGAAQNVAVLDAVFDGPCVDEPPMRLEARSDLVCRPEACLECGPPQLAVSTTADPPGMVLSGEPLRYTITVVNSSGSVGLDDVIVTDTLCDLVTYQGRATPAPSAAPPLGARGDVVWRLGPLAPGGIATLAFDAQVDADALSHCDGTDLTCTNRVSADGRCGDATAHATASYASPIECPQAAPLCRLSGGGCLPANGAGPGRGQSTFGGSVGPDGRRWEHLERDGTGIVFRWAAADVRVVGCLPVPSTPCPSPAGGTRVDFVGTGTYALGPGAREQAGNMVAYALDRDGGGCRATARDAYGIVVRDGAAIGSGNVVYQVQGELACGDLQVHDLPAGAGTAAGAPAGGALLGRAVPNPFAGSTSIAYLVRDGDGAPVDIAVYDVAGRMVRKLVTGLQPAGRHVATWDGRTETGTAAAHGVYFIRTTMAGQSAPVRQVVLLR